jgi:dihydrolipoamide dehydrogenase
MNPMTQSQHTELMIIGAGPGGYVAAIRAAKKGLKPTLVEKEWIGGTCLNVGCIPTKALIRSARTIHTVMHGNTPGLGNLDVDIDFESIIKNKDDVTKKLVSGIEYLLKHYGVEVIRGEATFVDDKTVRIKKEDETVDYGFDNCVIASGSAPKHLPIDGIDLDVVKDSTAILSLDERPESLVVIGGGIIGMEFAFIFGMLGVDVTVLEFMPQILPMLDKDVANRLLRYAKQANITVKTKASAQKIEKTDDGKAKVTYERKDKTKTVEADLVLEAVGRRPYADGLGLKNTSVEIEKDAVTVNDSMRTSVEGIYAIGDITNKMQLAHVASHQAIVAIDNILGGDKTMDYSAIPSVVFTTPEIAYVGKTETQLKEEGIDYEVLKVPFAANGKALILNDRTGFIKTMKDKDGKLLGATVFGSDAEHLIAPITMTMHTGVEAVKDMIFAHPTTEELIHEMVLGIDKEAIHFVDDK